MDFNLFFFNRCFDKNRLKALISWCLIYMGENATLEVVEDLKELGFRYATQAGISIGMNDLKTPPSKSFFVSQAEKNMRITEQEFLGGRITATEKSQRVVDTWHRTSEFLKQEVVDHFRFTDSLNPVYIMALSGARGNFSQVRQLVGMRGLMADPQGLIISFPIRSNFREGLTLTEYFISCYGARKGLVDTALRTADTGYLTRRLVDVSHHVVVRKATCKTQHGIFLTELRSQKKPILSLKERLIGRVLAATISLDTQVKTEDSLDGITNRRLSGTIAKRDQEISVDLAEKIAALGKPVFVRSPLTCSLGFDICQLCYGWSLSQGKLVTIGEAVGIIAAQSIGEPGTQLTMRTFHTGGVFSGDLLEEMSSPFSGYIEFPTPFQGLLIRTPHGRIAFLTKTSGLMVLTAMDPSKRGTLNSISPLTDNLDKTSSPEVMPEVVPKVVPKVMPEVVPKVMPEVMPEANTKFIKDSESTTNTSKTNQRFEINNLEIKNKSNSKNVESHKKIQFVLEPSTVLFVRQGEKVSKGQLLAQFSAIDEEQNERIQSKQILFAELSGQVYEESLVQKTNQDPDTGYQRKLSKTLGFVWIFSGREFSKNNSLDLYKRKNGHLVDTESIQFRLYMMKEKKRFVTNLDIDKVSNKRLAALFDIFTPAQIFDLKTFFHQINYKNNFGYAFSLFPLKSLIRKNKEREKDKHFLPLLNSTLLFRSWVDTENRRQENRLDKDNFGSISIRALRLEKNLDKLFFPQTMSSCFGGASTTIDQGSLNGDQLSHPLGKARHVLQKKIDNLRSKNSPPMKESLSLQKIQRSKNRHLLAQDQSSFSKHSVLINKQNISKFLFLLFLGGSSLPSGGSLEFNEFYLERDKNRGHLFWLPQENYQVVSLFQLVTEGEDKRRDLYKRGPNSLDTKNILRRSLLKRSLLASGRRKDILHCFRPMCKNQQFSPTPPLDSSSRKSVLNSQRVRLFEYAPFGISRIGPALYHETVSTENRFQSVENIDSRENRETLFKDCFTEKSEELLSLTGFWGNKKVPLGSALNLQGDLVFIFSRSSGWLTRYSILMRENIENIEGRDLPRFTSQKVKTNLKRLFLQFQNTLEIFSQRRKFGEETDTTTDRILWTNLAFVRSMPLEVLDSTTQMRRGSASRILRNSSSYSLRSNPCVQRHKAVLKASFNPLSYFVIDRKDLLKIGTRSSSSKTLITGNKGSSFLSPVLFFQYQRLALLNLLPSSFFVRMKSKKSKRTNQNYCLKMRPGWFYLPKSLHISLSKANTTKGQLCPNKLNSVVDDIAFEQAKMSVEFIHFSDSPFYLPLKGLSARFISTDIQQTSVNSVLEWPLPSNTNSQRKDIKRRRILSPLKPKRDQISTSLDDIWKNFRKESNAQSNKKTALVFNEFNKTASVQTDDWTRSNSLINGPSPVENASLSPKVVPSSEDKDSPSMTTLDQKEVFLNKNKALVVALEKNTQLGIIGRLTSKKRKLPHYFLLRNGLGNYQNSLESGLDQSVLLLIRQLLWTDSESFPLHKDWRFTPQQFYALAWLGEYRISTAIITNSKGRFSSICLPISPLQKTSSSYKKSNISKTNPFIHRFFPSQRKKMYSFEINRVLFDTSLYQGGNLSIRSFLEEEDIVNKESSFLPPATEIVQFPKREQFQTALLFEKVYEKPFVDVPTCKKLLYGTEIDLIGAKTKERKKTSFLNYSTQQIRMPLYTIAPGAHLDISQSFSFDTEMSEVFSLSPFHFSRLAINLTLSSVHSHVIFKKHNLTTWVVDPATEFMRRKRKGNTTEYQLVAPHPLSPGVYNRDFKKYSEDGVTSPTSPSINSRLMSRSLSREDEKETKLFSYKNFKTSQDTQQKITLENVGERSFSISLKGEVVPDPLGDTVLFNSDQVSFFTGTQPLQVIPGQLIRSGEEITVFTKGDSVKKGDQYSTITDQPPKEIPIASSENSLISTKSAGEFEKMNFDARNDKDMRLAVDRSGQVLKIEKNQITLRKAQAVLFYSQAVSHVSHGQWVTSGSPILTLTHQTLVTGDIVQGIPKIEQFFEASATKQGMPLAGNLHRKLQTIFKEHKKDLPRPKAVRKSLEDIQQVLVEGIQRVYLSQGVLIADKHLEVIVRQMTSKGKIIESGDTGLFHGELIVIRRIEGVNLMTPGKKAVYVPAVVGLTRTSLDSESFISAASFQETTRVLTRDVIGGKTDFLRGLKEKVVLGDLISAGTGLENYLMYNLVMSHTVKR